MMKNKERPVFGKILDALAKNKFVLLVVLAGILLILLPTGTRPENAESSEMAESVTEFSLYEQEQRMSKALSDINGAGRVTVVLTLKTSAEQVVALDRRGSSRNQSGDAGESNDEHSETTVIITAGSQKQSPVALKYIYPEYLGALVIAEGADSASVRLELLRAVAGLTGLGTDKITVTKMKNS